LIVAIAEIVSNKTIKVNCYHNQTVTIIHNLHHNLHHNPVSERVAGEVGVIAVAAQERAGTVIVRNLLNRVLLGGEWITCGI